MNKGLKRFVGEKAYNVIQNMGADVDKLRAALITPQNARNVFSELSDFEIKAICSQILNSGTIGTIRQTSQEEIRATFAKAGYTTVIFDDKEAIADCEKYYANGERICTYNNLTGRMNEYHMLVAIKGDIDKIKRLSPPQRDDEYGTSILNIQVARNGSHMSIKNRYNHTVSNCDSTFNNNLDMVAPGLQSMVLGYYGFASLARTEQQYKNIAIIGGVYLKWDVEHDGKYYGAFKLDASGPQYADPGRYHIVKRDFWPRLTWENPAPIILDFQKKQCAEWSCKGPLIARAMREGLLSSANKDQADTFTAVFTDARRELLETNKKALRYIAECYGYDFQKPFTVSAVMGKWTARSIEKATGITNGFLLACYGKNLKAVELDRGRFRANGIKRGYNYNMDTFFCQGSFEDARKSGTAAAFIISQAAEYRRVIANDTRVRYYSSRPDHQLDKGGNNLDETRAALYCRLRAFKTKRRAAEAASKDYSAEVAKVRASFDVLRASLVQAITGAQSSEDYSRIRKASGWSFQSLADDVLNLEKHAKANDFASVEQATKAISRALEEIVKLQNELAV